MLIENKLRTAPPMYSPFPKGSYDDIFKHFTDIICFLRKEGFTYLDEFALGEPYKNLKYTNNLFNLLSCCINLMVGGANNEYFNFVLEYEMLKTIHFSNSISEFELSQLIVMKHCMIYLRDVDVNGFYSYYNLFRSDDLGIYQKLKNAFPDF